MRRRLLVVMTLMSAMALALTGLVAAQETPEPEAPVDPDQDQQETAVVALDEMEGSGYRGIAVMHGEAQQTEIVVVVQETNGMMNGIGNGVDDNGVGEPDNGVGNDVGNGVGDGEVGNGVGETENGIGNDVANGQPQSAAIMGGSCESPGEIVEDLGELQQMQDLHVLVGTVQMGLDELLTGEYILAVLADDDAAAPDPGMDPAPEAPEAGATPTPAPGVDPNGVTNDVAENDVNALACGELTEDARVDDDDEVTPDAVEPFEPVEPTPAPGI